MYIVLLSHLHPCMIPLCIHPRGSPISATIKRRQFPCTPSPCNAEKKRLHACMVAAEKMLQTAAAPAHAVAMQCRKKDVCRQAGRQASMQTGRLTDKHAALMHTIGVVAVALPRLHGPTCSPCMQALEVEPFDECLVEAGLS